MRKAIYLLLLLSGCSLAPLKADNSYSVYLGETYVERESGSLTADIYVPEGNVKFPAVVMIHGGGWEGGEPSDMSRFAHQLVASGFVVMNISYRLAPEATHPAQIEDVREAVRWLRMNASRFKTDSRRIGAFGYSAGAHLAMLLAVNSVENEGQYHSRVRAVVAGSGPTDLRKYPDSKLVKGYLGGPLEGLEAVYADASPIVHVSPDDPPMYLYHGKRDTLVEVEQSLDMAAALRKVGVEAEMDVQPFGHVLTFFLDADVMQRALAFLEVHLKG